MRRVKPPRLPAFLPGVSLGRDEVQTFLEGRVVVLAGDITLQETDAIVNAANSSLMGGAGVDGAIHRRGGAQILEECREIRGTILPHGLPAGESVITGGGLLPARYVIHTVGPIYGPHAGRDAEILAMCYRSALELVVAHGLESVSFPAISTGAFGYPKPEASRVSSTAIARFLKQDRSVRLVQLVFFSMGDMELFLENQSFDDF